MKEQIQYQDYLKLQEYANTTIQTRLLFQRKLIEHLAALEKTIENATQLDLDKFFIKHKHETNRYFLKSYLKYANRTDLIVPKRRSKKPTRIPQPYSHHEIKQLMDMPLVNPKDKRNRLLIRLLYYTGMRASELLSITQPSINYHQNKILVRGKGNKERLVNITPQIAQEIKLYCDENKKTIGPIFNITRQWLYQIVKKQSDKVLGIKGWTHKIRSTIATDMHLNNADVILIQHYLGHSSSAVTERYVKVDAAQIDKKWKETTQD